MVSSLQQAVQNQAQMENREQVQQPEANHPTLYQGALQAGEGLSESAGPASKTRAGAVSYSRART